MNRGGIYEIVNLVNGHRYVGSAVDLEKRWREHKRDFRAGRRHNQRFLRAWRGHGEGAFAFRVLIVCNKENLLMYEQRALDMLRPEYNLAPIAGSMLGFRHSGDSRARMIGKVRSPEHCKAISDAKKGRPIHTPDSLRRMSETMRAIGIKPPSTKGQEKSAEHRLKISAAMQGNKNTRGFRYSEERKIAAYASRRK